MHMVQGPRVDIWPLINSAGPIASLEAIHLPWELGGEFGGVRRTSTSIVRAGSTVRCDCTADVPV
eukprot:scaffold537431_cov28-Prasinocladus_malaysianus.AAC.1